ncbi:MAG: AAA family ATPase [Spirochaetales bacterium]|nr:AAA family ATPase [Spirochaetales bacterium]
MIIKAIMHIHIFGASGSGTTSLGKALSGATEIPAFDSDSFFWEETDPPFTKIKPRVERQQLLATALSGHTNWILTGSMMDWGDFLIPDLDLAVYLYIPQEIRLERLIKREKERYGKRIEPGNDMHNTHLEFIKWARDYDTGGLEIRSRKSHREWMKKLGCKIIKITEILTISEEIELILSKMDVQ